MRKWQNGINSMPVRNNGLAKCHFLGTLALSCLSQGLRRCSEFLGTEAAPIAAANEAAAFSSAERREAHQRTERSNDGALSSIEGRGRIF
jgi:hypothetical protein